MSIEWYNVLRTRVFQCVGIRVDRFVRKVDLVKWSIRKSPLSAIWPLISLDGGHWNVRSSWPMVDLAMRLIRFYKISNTNIPIKYIRRHQKAPAYFREMFPSICPESLTIFQNAPKCLKSFQNLSKMFKKFPNIPKFPEFSKFSKLSKILQIVFLIFPKQLQPPNLTLNNFAMRQKIWFYAHSWVLRFTRHFIDLSHQKVFRKSDPKFDTFRSFCVEIANAYPDKFLNFRYSGNHFDICMVFDIFFSTFFDPL